MATITACDWCRQPIDSDDQRTQIYGFHSGGFCRDFHAPDFHGRGKDCCAEWRAAVELVEQHHEFVEGWT